MMMWMVLYIMGGDWGSAIAPVKDELPLKGDTVVGNDVWIGQNVTVMPGVHIGDGAIIGTNSVVASDIPPYSVAAGNPCRVIRKRFDDEFIAYLLELIPPICARTCNINYSRRMVYIILYG